MQLVEKQPIWKHNVYNGVAINKGNITILRDAWPLAEGWYALIMTFKFVLTNTTGTTAISEGLLNILKDIMLKTDYDGIIFKGNGRQLVRRAQIQAGTLPYFDTTSVTAGTYYVQVPFFFANPRSQRPEDTILNTARYKNIELHVTAGDVSDLMSSVGDSVVTITADISLIRTALPLDTSNAPIYLPYVMGLPPVDPNVQQYIDIEKNLDMAVRNFLIFTTNSATGGIPCSGTPASNVLKNLTVYDNFNTPFRNIPINQLIYENKQQYQLETALTGVVCVDFMPNDSNFSAYVTGNKAVLQLQWTNDTLSTSQVTAMIDGVKRMK